MVMFAVEINGVVPGIYRKGLINNMHAPGRTQTERTLISCGLNVEPADEIVG
jgi:hypothetical protein